MVRAVVAVCVVVVTFRVAAFRSPWSHELLFSSSLPTTGQLARARLLARLRAEEGKQLVIVHYAENHNPHEEWVYNRADIDNSKVVWAREMDSSEDEKLIAYFNDRRVWLLEPDLSPPRLSPYRPLVNPR